MCNCWNYFLFFNDPATTQIYTYLHTLSLHDALPIYDIDALKQVFADADAKGWFIEAMFLEPVMGEGDPGRSVPVDFYNAARALTKAHGSLLLRSEEHTSELPSLMRISYAVFCLKKKPRSKTSKYHENKHRAK